MHTRLERLEMLLALSKDLGAPHRDLAILGEGNTSARLGAETFLVKASGSSLGTLSEQDVVECRFAPLLAMLDREEMGEQEIEDELFNSRVDPKAKKPSVEALFHAYLLSLPDVHFAGHTHSASVNQILCSPRAAEFAERRMYPDEVVCCGSVSLFVPYADPGLKLSQAIRRAVEASSARPRVILLENHGLITFGATPNAVRGAMLMADKAARIFMGAAAMGGPKFLPSDQVDHIANRLDEQYRRRALKL